MVFVLCFCIGNSLMNICLQLQRFIGFLFKNFEFPFCLWNITNIFVPQERISGYFGLNNCTIAIILCSVSLESLHLDWSLHPPSQTPSLCSSPSIFVMQNKKVCICMSIISCHLLLLLITHISGFEGENPESFHVKMIRLWCCFTDFNQGSMVMRN